VISRDHNTIKMGKDKELSLEEVNGALEAEVKELKKQVKQLNADLKEKDQIIKEIRSASPSAAAEKTFELDGAEYCIAAFGEAKWKGQLINADQIVKDSKLQAELIKAKVGFITKKEA
jgi:seryl-tRNA synthetase